MKIIAVEQELESNVEAKFKKYAKDEARQVWNLFQEGKIREVYFRQDIPNAVLFLECKDVEEAYEILGTLPFVKNNLIRFDLIPLKPYSGFSRLFEEDNSNSNLTETIS
jgi:hypothetical protein